MLGTGRYRNQNVSTGLMQCRDRHRGYSPRPENGQSRYVAVATIYWVVTFSTTGGRMVLGSYSPQPFDLVLKYCALQLYPRARISLQGHSG